MANSVDPDQTANMGAVCSGSTLFASILNSSAMSGNYLQQTTSADDIFRCSFFLGALRVKKNPYWRGSLGAFFFFTYMHICGLYCPLLRFFIYTFIISAKYLYVLHFSKHLFS